MSSFNSKDRQAFGQSVRLSMALMDAEHRPDSLDEVIEQCSPSNPIDSLPIDEIEITHRIKSLSKVISSCTANQLELLVRFDELEAWKTNGSRHCVAWLNLELGISLQLGWEYLRVGRKLRELPITTALFRGGKLTWSKIRVLTRVANSDNEGMLCHAALDASASDVERLCNEYRWEEHDDESADAENKKAIQQWEARSFTWSEASNGNTCIRLSLPPELAQAFLYSVEHSLTQLETADDTKMAMKRADAAALMAETSLQNAGRDIATADRFQVTVLVDSQELHNAECSAADGEFTADGESNAQMPLAVKPKKNPTLLGAGPIGHETARRIACDCSVSTITLTNGEPTDIGRKSRIWTAVMSRAIKARDQHCQFPGCTMTQHLHIHHIKHWANGGTTCVDNGVCLCSYHHMLVHEGGYRIERVSNTEGAPNEQFARQQKTDDEASAFEILLRDSRESFDFVRGLSPTRYRFRVLDKEGNDIQDSRIVTDSTEIDSTEIDSTEIDSTEIDSQHNYSTYTVNKTNPHFFKNGIAELRAHYGQAMRL